MVGVSIDGRLGEIANRHDKSSASRRVSSQVRFLKGVMLSNLWLLEMASSRAVHEQVSLQSAYKTQKRNSLFIETFITTGPGKAV